LLIVQQGAVSFDDIVTVDRAEPEVDVVAWTIVRLLALAGEAEKVAASVPTPSGKWPPPWMMCGHRAQGTGHKDPGTFCGSSLGQLPWAVASVYLPRIFAAAGPEHHVRWLHGGCMRPESKKPAAWLALRINVNR